MQIFPVGLRASRRAGMITKAAFLAKNKMEEVKMAGFDAVIELSPKIVLSGEDNDFEWEISVDEIDLEGIESSDDIRKVTVTVKWVERRGRRDRS